MTDVLFEVASAVAATVWGLNYYVYRGFGRQPNLIRRIPNATGKIVLTFDDGPHKVYTPKILDVLAQYQVPAVFFLVGQNTLKYPEIARRIVTEGHEIGNHTYRHSSNPFRGYPRIYRDLRLTSEIIESAVGVRPRYFRPPRGLYSREMVQAAEDLGMLTVLWTLSSVDWRPLLQPRTIHRRIASRTRDGYILLFHDSGTLTRAEGGKKEATVRALPFVIEQLRQDGYTFARLSDLLADSRSPATPFRGTGAEIEERAFPSNAGFFEAGFRQVSG
jgi:peptidoglycan/xylan/chitin deacetylase (PgdA/CDA1 family)